MENILVLRHVIGQVWRIFSSSDILLVCCWQHDLWVTKFDPNERFPGGDFPNQNPREGEGLKTWIQRDHNLENASLVLWSVVLTHAHTQTHMHTQHTHTHTRSHIAAHTNVHTLTDTNAHRRTYKCYESRSLPAHVHFVDRMAHVHVLQAPILTENREELVSK
jgi:hypothetical protein